MARLRRTHQSDTWTGDGGEGAPIRPVERWGLVAGTTVVYKFHIGNCLKSLPAPLPHYRFQTPVK